MEQKHWKTIKRLSFAMVFVISVSFGVYITSIRTDEDAEKSKLITEDVTTIEKLQKGVIFADVFFLLLFAFAKSKSGD